MPRAKLPPRRDIHLRLSEEIFAELVTLRPELQDPLGPVRYGALNNYFIYLVQRDLEERKRVLRAQTLVLDTEAVRRLKEIERAGT